MQSRKKIYLWTINGFVIIVAIVLLGTIFLTLASATISIKAERDEFTNSSVFDVSTSGSDDDLQGEIHVREFELSESFSIEGSSITTASKAGGFVTIINDSSRNQPLVATTRLLTPEDKLFRIQEGVTVPVGEEVTVFAEADEEGDTFLIDSSSFIIPGLNVSLQEQIYSKSESSMSYDRFGSAVVTQDDVSKAEATLTEKIVAQVIEQLNSELNRDFTVTTDHATVKRISSIANPLPGAESEQVTVTLKLEITALVLDPQVVIEASTKQLIQKLPNPNDLLEVIEPSLTYSVTTIDGTNNQAQITTKLSAWTKSEVMPDDIDLKQLTGKSVKDAEQYLLSQGIQGAQIKVKPSWLPKLPFIKKKITIELN